MDFISTLLLAVQSVLLYLSSLCDVYELQYVLLYQDDLKKQVLEGSLTVSGSNDILTMALGTAEHSGRVRGVGAYVNPSSYFNEPVRHGKKVNEIIKETVKQLIEEERMKGHALAKEMVAVEREYWVDKMAQLEAKIERFSKAQGSPILPIVLTPPTHLSDKGSCSAAKIPDGNNVEPKACNENKVYLTLLS